MNAYRTFDARVRAAARAATPIDRLLLLAEDLALAVLSPGRGRFPKGKLTADERRAFGVEKLLGGALGRAAWGWRAPSSSSARGPIPRPPASSSSPSPPAG